MRWYWPKLTSSKEAEQAAHQGAAVCFVIAAFTGIAAAMSFWLDRPVLGLHAGAIADAIIFAAAGWRIWRLSRIWAVLALVIYLMEKIYAVEVASGPVPAPGVYICLIFTLVLISSVRGTFAYYKLKKKESAPSGATVSSSHGDAEREALGA